MEERQPCKDLQFFKQGYNEERSDLKRELNELAILIRQLEELINKQDKRIALLEQQNKLTLWVYALITSGLVTVIIKMM